MTTVLARGAVLKITRRHKEMVKNDVHIRTTKPARERIAHSPAGLARIKPRRHCHAALKPVHKVLGRRRLQVFLAATSITWRRSTTGASAEIPLRWPTAVSSLRCGTSSTAANATAPPGCVASSAMAAHCNRTCRCVGWRVGTDTATSWCPLSPTKNRNRNRQ